MHLIRLLHAGIDLVATGALDVTVPEERRASLLAIKRGEIDWDEIAQLRRQLVAEFEDAFSRTVLPDEPDTSRAESFLIDVRLAVAAGAAQ